MSSNVTLNGVQYIVPAYNDTGWAQGVGNLSLYLAAIASSTLQPTGGAFTLTADVDFGSNFGLKALFLKTETANPASAGVIRLASADAIKWRNNANGADVSLSKDSSDNLLWATNKVYTAGGAAGIVNADIASGAAIAYSKLALTGAILNADLAGSIAYSKLVLTGAILNADLAGSIAYSKLVLTGSIVNGDLTAGTLTNAAINASAAIALSKLAALGTGKALQSNASTGFIEASSVTNTELGYVSGVTSAIQTQLNATIANPLTSNLAAGSHKLTGLAAGSTSGDSVRYEQLNLNAAGYIIGTVVQSVQATDTTLTTSSGTTYTSTATAATIVPKATTHKIKISVVGTLQNTAPSSNTANVSVFRGSTDLSNGSGFSQIFAGTLTGYLNCPVGITYLDSPATTSSTVYTVKIKSGVAADAVWNAATGSANILLEEIAF